MNDKRFDDIIKGKLDHLKPFNGEDVWSSFESKLDSAQPIISDSDFDEKVKGVLQSHKPRYKSQHWQMLKTELITIETRKNTIFLSKVLELAAIFLIIFTFTHVPDHLYQDKTIQKEDLIASLKQDEKTINKSGAKSVTIESTLKNAQSKTVSKNKTMYEQVLPSVLDHLFTHTDIASTSSAIHDSDISMAGFDKPSLFSITALPKSASIPTSQKVENKFDLVLPYSTHSPSVALASKQAADAPEGSKSVTPILSKGQTATLETEMATIIPTKIELSVKKERLSLSLWTAKDVNLINTPFDKLYSLASYKKEALNDSYGANISKQWTNVEIQTGIGYLKKEYQPKKIIEAFGQFGDNYFEKSLNKISYDLLTVPLNIKYHGWSGNGWSAYMMVGAAFYVVANAEYDITETLVRTKPSSLRYIPDEPRLDKKPFITGVLNGDRFKDNYYAAIGFGFGLEKTLFGYTSLYIQPSYFRHILSYDIGIGPNKDKIHTSSLQVGIKTVIH